MSDSTAAKERWFLDQKEVYRQILDAIADMVLVKGAQSRILWANKAFRDYYGMSNEQLRDQVDASFNELDYTAQYVRDDLHVYNTGQVLNIHEEPVTRHDGLVQIFHTVKSPIRDPEGAVLLTVGVSRNITEQKRVNEDLSRYREHLERLVDDRTKELSSLSNNLSTILSSLAEGIVALDAEGRIQLVNPAAETLLGLTAIEMVGRRLHDVIEFAPELGEPSRLFSLSKLLGSARPTTGHLRSRSGENRLVSLHAVPLQGATGAPSGSVLVVRDITLEREVADQRLRQQKLESLGLLAGGIAHDFNNILSGILGSISVARCDVALGKSVDELLERAEGACVRAQQLTTQLLTFAQGGAPVKKTIGVIGLIREAAELALSGSSSQLVLTSATDVSRVAADPGQLAQVINNLVMNAHQAMPNGGQVTIHIGNVVVAATERLSVKPGNYVRITVRDYGGGIPAEHLDRIFDPYFTTKTSASGLGLASVHSIVQQHGGHVLVASTPNAGTQFSLYLPAVEPDPARDTARMSSRSAAEQQRILVLDDDEGVRKVMAAVLSLLGHEAVIVGCSHDAFAAFEASFEERRPFSAVIVDLTMPGDLAGKDVIERLLGRDPRARVIVMSGYSTDPVMANFESYGLAARLQKPFTVAHVRDVLGS